MAEKPPRRNLPPAAELWGRFVDGKLHSLEAKIDNGLKNIQAALKANTSSLKNLSYLADSGWLTFAWGTVNGTPTQTRWRRVGGNVTVDVAVTGSFAVGVQAVITGITGDFLPDANMYGSVYFSSGYTGVAYITPGGTLNVAHQSGATRSNPQITIVYPAKRIV